MIWAQDHATAVQLGMTSSLAFDRCMAAAVCCVSLHSLALPGTKPSISALRFAKLRSFTELQASQRPPDKRQTLAWTLPCEASLEHECRRRTM